MTHTQVNPVIKRNGYFLFLLQESIIYIHILYIQKTNIQDQSNFYEQWH